MKMRGLIFIGFWLCYISFILMSLGCSNDSSFRPLPILRYKEPLPQIATFINKIGVIAPTGETTPIVFNGAVYLIHDKGQDFEILDENGSLIHLQPANVEYVSGFAHSGFVYVFGSERLTHNKIVMFKSPDLVTWSAPVTVLTGSLFFNTSVTIDSAGFIMASEYLEDDIFKTKFYRSQDLLGWLPAGHVMFPQYYTAAPTIRYFAPYYYVFYTSESDPAIHHSWNLNCARSIDLVSWQDSSIQVVAASQEPQDNASDLDFVEFNGVTKIYYINNSQTMQAPLPGAGLIKAEYAGTLQSFAQEFF